MSRWLGRIWGGMRLCGNTASLAQVATKQREVFRRLCNMYMVTPATACPQGINGGLAVADGRRDRGLRACVRAGCASGTQSRGGICRSSWGPGCDARHRAERRGEKSSVLWQELPFPPPCSQDVSKAAPRNRLAKSHFPKEGPLDFKEKTKKFESGPEMKASRAYVPRQGGEAYSRHCKAWHSCW